MTSDLLGEVNISPGRTDLLAMVMEQNFKPL